MRPKVRLYRIAIWAALSLAGLWGGAAGEPSRDKAGGDTPLPKPRLDGNMPLEQAIQKRRSERDFVSQPLTLAQVSQLLWSAQGITEESIGLRAAPSAGGLYPLDLYLIIGEKGVEGLEAGIYLHNPHQHAIRLLAKGDLRDRLARACLRQMFIAQAPVCLVITAEYRRITDDYGDRGTRYAHIEVGHIAQNIYLQAVAMGLGTTGVGAFYEHAVSEALSLPDQRKPLYVMPIGYPE